MNVIRSAAVSVDGLERAKFDAAGYFVNATGREIVVLAAGDWRGDQAVEAARSLIGNEDPDLFPGLRAVFEHVRDNSGAGIVAAMHGPDALRWIKEHRVDIAATIELDFGEGASDTPGCDPGPDWDRDEEWAGAYETGRGDVCRIAGLSP